MVRLGWCTPGALKTAISRGVRIPRVGLQAVRAGNRVGRKARRLLQWWARQVPVVSRTKTEPWRGRWHLLALDWPGRGLGADWSIWPRITPREFRARLGDGDIWFTRAGINGDRGAFGEIFIVESYATDYRGAV